MNKNGSPDQSKLNNTSNQGNSTLIEAEKKQLEKIKLRQVFFLFFFKEN